MQTIQEAFASALHLMVSLNAGLIEIVLLSLRVSLTAVLCAALIGLPLGAGLALFQFPGRRFAAIVLSSLMGMPPVVVGLIVYLLLSRSGPLGVFGLLFSPTAMILAQIVIVTPIVAALTRQLVEDLWTLDCGPRRAMATLLWDGRFSLMTALLAGFGRASAEVGAVMIVGGNIDHVTRMMTTAIALETSKGDLALALGLGIILIILSLGVNGAAFVIRDLTGRHP
jgi:tungstate transport system permease protein